MAIVLQNTTFETGQQSQSQLNLASLLWIMDVVTFPNPFAVADIKTALEAGQPGTWDTAAFNQYLQELYDLPIDNSVLTATERTRINLIREEINPPPSTKLCGVAPVQTVANGGNTDITNIQYVGSATFQYEVQVRFEENVTCDVFEVELVSVVTTSGGPAYTGTLGSIYFLENDFTGNQSVYSLFWGDWAANPSTEDYDFTINVKDKNGASLSGGNFTINETIP